MIRLLQRSRRRVPNEDGFTVVELLVYFMIASIIIGSVYQLLIGQGRLYTKQRELMDVRATLRAAAALLTWELRQASASGDLYSIASDSFAIRSIQGGGIVCGEHVAASRVGLWGTWGEFYATADDSALVFAAGNDVWLVGSIDQIYPDHAAAGVQWCDWGGSSTEPDMVVDVSLRATPPDVSAGTIILTPQGAVSAGATLTFVASHPALTCAEFDSRALLTIDAPPVTSGPMNGCTFTVTIPNQPPSQDFKIKIEITKDDYPQLDEDLLFDAVWYGSTLDSPVAPVTDYVDVGAPFRAFRSTQYGIYQEDGRWWLGRKVGAAASYEKLAGPLRAPADSGLVLTYYDGAGNTTAIPMQVALVEIILRGESFGKVPRTGQAPAVQRDTLTTRVSLRG